MSTKEHQCDKECKHGSTGYEQTIDELKFENSIHNACVQGDFDRVKKLIEKKGFEIVNEKDKNGYTALHYAARNNHLEICKLLIKNGANTNATTFSCQSTPLHRASFCHTTEIVKLLLENKSDPFLKDIDGRNSLHKCLQNSNSMASNSPKLSACFDTAKILVNFDRKLLKETDRDNKTVIDYYPQLMSHLNI